MIAPCSRRRNTVSERKIIILSLYSEAETIVKPLLF